MTDKKLDQLAREYEESITSIVGPGWAESFIAGYRARDAEVAKLREALEYIADARHNIDLYPAEIARMALK
jgi:hypothetical protein